MLTFLRRLTEDDNALKLLFDHMRNVGIAAVVLGAAHWKQQHSRAGSEIDMGTVALLYALGVFLFAVNFHNGVIVHVHGNREGQMAKPIWVKALVGTFYALLVSTMIEYLASK